MASHTKKLNLKIYPAYLLKEGFPLFWFYTYRAWAEKYLGQWVWWAPHSKLEPMWKFAWMIRRHQENILNYFKARIGNRARSPQQQGDGGGFTVFLLLQ
jgi:transposase